MASKASVKEAEIKFQPDLDINEQVRKIIVNKKRNLEKRKLKLEELVKKKENGEVLNSSQLDAVSNFNCVIESIQVLQTIHDQVNQLYTSQAKWLKKENKKSASIKAKNSETPNSEIKQIEVDQIIPEQNIIQDEKITLTVETNTSTEKESEKFRLCLFLQTRIHRLLQCFGDDNVRKQVLNDPLFNQKDLDHLDEVNDILNPLALVEDLAEKFDPIGSSAPIPTKDVFNYIDASHDHMVLFILRSSAPMLEDGTTYEQIAELCERLFLTSYFLDWSPVNKEKLQKKDEIIESVITNSQQIPVESIPNKSSGVDIMLKNFGTPFSFIQNASTPPNNFNYQDHAISHKVDIIQPSIQAIQSNEVHQFNPNLQPSVNSYWENKTNVQNKIDELPNEQQPKTTVWDSEKFSNQFENRSLNQDEKNSSSQIFPVSTINPVQNVQINVQSIQQEQHLIQQLNPSRNLSWADKVRPKGSEFVMPVSEFVQENSGDDVFATASQSQFMSSDINSNSNQRSNQNKGRGTSDNRRFVRGGGFSNGRSFRGSDFRGASHRNYEGRSQTTGGKV